MSTLTPFKKITTLIFDVDGVFTDSSLLVTESGEMLRSMNTRDGMAVKRAIKKGFKVIIITGGTSLGVKARLQGLGIVEYFDNVQKKLEIFHAIKERLNLVLEETIYMGDDIPDLQVMQLIGLPCAPYDACPEILSAAKYISPIAGGKGCVRDVIEKVMRIQGKW